MWQLPTFDFRFLTAGSPLRKDDTPEEREKISVKEDSLSSIYLIIGRIVIQRCNPRTHTLITRKAKKSQKYTVILANAGQFTHPTRLNDAKNQWGLTPLIRTAMM